MICYLIRHGQQIHHPGDPGLTDVGKVQAHEVGTYFLDKHIDTIISSPLKRTIETTKEITSVLGIGYSENPDLVERMNWDSSASSFEQFLHEWNRTTIDRNYVPMHGDSSITTGMRIKKAIDTLKNVTNVILVTHGGAIGDYLNVVFNKQESFEEYQISHCSITKVVFDDTPYIDILNYTSHLSTMTE